jgi:hypothetical protein
VLDHHGVIGRGQTVVDLTLDHPQLLAHWSGVLAPTVLRVVRPLSSYPSDTTTHPSDRLTAGRCSPRPDFRSS